MLINLFSWKILIIILVLSCCACTQIVQEDYGSSNRIEFVPNTEYAINIAYDANDISYAVEFISKSNRVMCLNVMEWYGKDGVHFFPPETSIVIQKIRYSLRREFEDYCLGGFRECNYIIKKGRVLRGKLYAKDFDIPVEIELLDLGQAELKIHVNPFYCDDKM